MLFVLRLVLSILVICVFIYLYCWSITSNNIEDLGKEGIELNDVRVNRVEMDSFLASIFTSKSVVGPDFHVCLKDYRDEDARVTLFICSLVLF